VIQAVGGRDLQVTQAIFDSMVSTSKSLRPAGSPKITFIYTSGIVVHGEYQNDIVTDTTPITKPGDIAKGHAVQEVAVRENHVFNGIVIRPGFVFGRSMVGSAFGAMLFDQVRKTGKVVWPGKPGGHLPVIHQDDLADMYLRAAEKGQLLGGQVFDGVNETTENTDAVLQRVVDVTGVKGPYEYREPQTGKC
jgi:nucleoside-diphosphate-sugar epimerase